MQVALPTPKCTCDGCKCDIGKRLIQLKDKERLYEFLLGLDNDFVVIMNQVLATNSIPSLGNAYHLVSEDERQRAISSEKKPSMEATTFKTNTSVKWENNNPSQHQCPTHLLPKGPIS